MKRHCLVKTRPASEERTGALIRAALERCGVAHRVGGGAVERGWLATTGQSGAAVYITAHHPGQAMSYDVFVDGLIGIHAVTFSRDTGTRFVYAGDPDDLYPDAAVEAARCAEAVASFLGLPVAEPERVCLHCGRGIEWIEADGQGAWYDSSNWIGCVDGESLHAPAPFCGWCEDSGHVTIHHGTDGPVGSRVCEWPPCVGRRGKAAARQAQKHTDSFVAGDGSAEYGPQICASCHWGGFTPNGQYAKGRPVYVCTADGCGYTVAHADLMHGLEGEQSLTVIDGRLYIAEPYDGLALPPF